MTFSTDCPKCHMPQDRWLGNYGKGYVKDDEVYCCQGCAENKDCLCGPLS